MRSVAALVALVGLTSCVGNAEPSAASSDLVGVEDMRVVETRGDRRLLRGAASVSMPQTDERPTFWMAFEDSAGRVESDGRVLGGALVESGVLWVTADRLLVDGLGTVVDRDVLPELAVSADGRLAAYPRAAGEHAGVYVVTRQDGSWSAPRRVTAGLADADRPLLLGDGRLVVIGSVASGIAGVWLIDLRGGAPLAVTNGALRTGRPLGPSFVPPPAYHASMRVEQEALVYDDGHGERRVALPIAAPARGALR